MEFKLIHKELEKELKKRYNKNPQTEEELKNDLSCYRKSYKGDFKTQKKKFLSYLKNRFEKDYKQQENLIKSISEGGSLSHPLIITIEWKKSKMWGSNPKAYTNYGFEGESIGGCGYDKLSTATAEALNSNKSVLKLLYLKEEKRLKENLKPERRVYIGYGSGYFVLPSFEGGVGVSSHQGIIEGLGLKWENITSTSQTDVFRIAKE